jgi:hypothetical protein
LVLGRDYNGLTRPTAKPTSKPTPSPTATTAPSAAARSSLPAVGC